MNRRTGYLAVAAAVVATAGISWLLLCEGSTGAPPRAESRGGASTTVPAEPAARRPAVASAPARLARESAGRSPRTVAPEGPPAVVFDAAFDAADRWLRAREEARAAREPAEKGAKRERLPEKEVTPERQAWDEQRQQLLAVVRRDLAAACALLDRAAAYGDPQVALETARVLAHVGAPGFEDVLIEAATESGPATRRQVALVGLRGRGSRAADAVASVAGTAEEVELRAYATRELASHLVDPAAIDRRTRMLDTLGQNLVHESVEVRRAAVLSIVASRRPVDATVQARLQEMSRSDPDQQIRQYAQRALGRRNG